ncbi:uncharacterized protein LOC101456852 [Ceratitis capitata]|nr:uncharacterized protein LOC101456852 [Ceratitis capitata]
MGYCFLANNIMDHNHIDELPLKFSTFGDGNSLRMFLKQESLWKYEMYVHSNEDIPYFGLLSQTLGQDHKKYIYNMEEIQNSLDVKDENLKKRKCKFPMEIIFGSSYPYSFSSCMSDLRIVLELKICSCTLFTSPKKFFNFFCNITGMTCISKGKLYSIETCNDAIQNRSTPQVEKH